MAVLTHQLRSRVTAAPALELSIDEVELPDPRADQVLVRVEAAPLNPSDLGLLLAGADPAGATATGTPERPFVALPLSSAAARAAAGRLDRSLPVGNEGAGTVVAAGSAPDAQALLGRVVAVAGGATYAEHVLVDAAACLSLPDGTRPADAAGSFVNPMTAIGMVETMRAEGHTGLVHTAAASNLGRMLRRLCVEEGVPLVDVVRSPAQVAILRDEGAAHVCDSSSDDFGRDLVAALRATSATLAFDAVGGGPLADRILTAMETVAAAEQSGRYGSSVHKQVYVYGGLDRGPTVLTRSYGMAWGIGGWLLTPFLARAGAERVAAMRQRVVAGLTTTFASHFTREITLAEALDPDVISAYARQSTGSKFLITPAVR